MTLGLEDGAWRLDPTAHRSARPSRTATSGSRPATTRPRGRSGRRCEAGHGLYAHGIADSLLRSPLAGAPSLGLNESQSRTWENLVGRSRPFWEHWYEPLQETFPSLREVDLDRFVRAINRAEPGLIRVDADETTYTLHIILRFELEQELLEGTVALEDLPEVWNARMKEFLGWMSPTTRTASCKTCTGRGRNRLLPDVRARERISLQIWHVVREAMPELDDQLAAGELLRCRTGCGTRSSLGRKLMPKETIERLTGSPEIDPAPYLAYLRDKVAALAA